MARRALWRPRFSVPFVRTTPLRRSMHATSTGAERGQVPEREAPGPSKSFWRVRPQGEPPRSRHRQKRLRADPGLEAVECRWTGCVRERSPLRRFGSAAGLSEVGSSGAVAICTTAWPSEVAMPNMRFLTGRRRGLRAAIRSAETISRTGSGFVGGWAISLGEVRASSGEPSSATMSPSTDALSVTSARTDSVSTEADAGRFLFNGHRLCLTRRIVDPVDRLQWAGCRILFGHGG